jgi:hypothetical protein
MTPLEYFEARWAAEVPALPLFNPSAMHVDLAQMPSPWAGVIVQAQEYRNMTLGTRPWREETGTYVLGIFQRPGDGFAAADGLARQVREAFMDWHTDDGALHVEAIDGPLDIDPAAEDGWHRLALEIQYQIWTQPP